MPLVNSRCPLASRGRGFESGDSSPKGGCSDQRRPVSSVVCMEGCLSSGWSLQLTVEQQSLQDWWCPEVALTQQETFLCRGQSVQHFFVEGNLSSISLQRAICPAGISSGWCLQRIQLHGYRLFRLGDVQRVVQLPRVWSCFPEGIVSPGGLSREWSPWRIIGYSLQNMRVSRGWSLLVNSPEDGLSQLTLQRMVSLS